MSSIVRHVPRLPRITPVRLGALLLLVAACDEGRPPPTGELPARSAREVDDPAPATTPKSAPAPEAPPAETDPLACPVVSQAPSATPSVCDPNRIWGTATKLSISTGAPDYLLALTPDARSIAWYSVTPSAAFFVSDRASEASDFGSRIALDVAADRIGLSPDGLRVFVVAPDLRGLSEMTRASREEDFGAPEPGAFAAIDAALAAAPEDSVTDPVVSGDDRILVYTRFAPGAADTIWMSTRASANDPWPAGAPLDSCELRRHDGIRRVPFALSADGRTLFYLDEPRGKARAAFRASIDAAFATFVDLPDGVVGAAPNGACDRLTYSLHANDAIDIVVAAGN